MKKAILTLAALFLTACGDVIPETQQTINVSVFDYRILSSFCYNETMDEIAFENCILNELNRRGFINGGL